MNAETEYSNKPVKEIPYSASRVYLPHVTTFDNGVLIALPSGAKYTRMEDGSLRRVKRIEQIPEGVPA